MGSLPLIMKSSPKIARTYSKKALKDEKNVLEQILKLSQSIESTVIVFDAQRAFFYENWVAIQPARPQNSNGIFCCFIVEENDTFGNLFFSTAKLTRERLRK